MNKVLYIRDRHGKNFGTVVYDVSQRREGIIHFQVASCNSKDLFSKYMGVSIATSRLADNPHLLNVRPDSLNNDVVKAILTKISRTDGCEVFPPSIKKLSRKMLRSYKQ